MLKIKNLTKNFGEMKAVNNCSFEIETGKITALIGPNGSGKTTIFNLISGIIKPDQGGIFLNNQNIINYSVDRISNFGISRLFQQPRLFKNLTVKENLLLAIDNEDVKFWKNIFGLNKTTAEKEGAVLKILKDVGILETKNKLAGDLSFGQKRLMELAMAILNPHQLLILDEPVGGVSPKIKENIAKFLLDLKKQGQTILIIEHNMPFIMNIADWIIVINVGRVIAEGPPDEIKRNKDALEAYLGD